MYSRSNGRSVSGDGDFYAKRDAAMAEAKNAYAASSRVAIGPSSSSYYARGQTESSVSRETRDSAPSSAGAAPVGESNGSAAAAFANTAEINAPAYAVNNVDTFGSLRSFVQGLEIDDILIIAVFFLLFNENKEDDILILLVLAVLFFT